MSVIVIVSFSQFPPLLQIKWVNFNQTPYRATCGKGVSSFSNEGAFKWFSIEIVLAILRNRNLKINRIEKLMSEHLKVGWTKWR